MLPAQELRHFEFGGLLEHELSPESNGLGERSTASGHAEELFLEDLAGRLAFHGCCSLSVEPRQWSLHLIGFYRKLRTSPAEAASV